MTTQPVRGPICIYTEHGETPAGQGHAGCRTGCAEASNDEIIGGSAISQGYPSQARLLGFIRILPGHGLLRLIFSMETLWRSDLHVFLNWK
jgi:hypothetical protein